MSKKLLLAVAVLVVGLVPLLGTAAAQDDRVLVWFATSQDDTDAFAGAAERFASEQGVSVDIQYIQPALLYESVASASQGGSAGPDIIIADNSVIEPLVSAGLIAAGRDGGTLFLADLLRSLPSLIQDRCPDADTPVESCLWPQTSPTLPIPALDNDTTERTADFLCQSSPWLPFCRGGELAGVPVSWWFNIYLVNASWAAQNGTDVPSTAEGVLELQNEFGLSIPEAESGNVPLVQDTNSAAVVLISSMLIVEDPNGVMRSLGSFGEAGYAAVLDLRVDAAYVTASATNPDLARAFVDFLARDVDLQTALVGSSQRLPAFTADILRERSDSEAGTAVFQAVVTLVAYANQLYY